MNSAEQINISDPEAFLQTSLKDGVVLCRLLERLSPGSTDKVRAELRFVFPSSARLCLRESDMTRFITSLFCANWSMKILFCRSRERGLFRTQLLVKARFNFEQTNEDELSFNKSDVINVTRQEEGGWWEGNLNGKTGWFPSNYVREIKGCDKQVSPKSGTLSPPKGFDTTAISKTYYNLVLQNILETETEYSKDLQSLLTNYLRSLQSTEKLSSTDVYLILGNLEEISTFQQMLIQSLEECTKLPESQQKVGSFFLNLMPQMKALYVSYCSNHPSAVNVLTQHSEELGEFMEGKGASSPGILTLTTGLSKPFMRLDTYPTLTKELERHMEESHPDRPDIQKCMTTFNSLSAQCQEVRKRKELELQIVTESIRLWEGEDIRTLGSVLYMSQALVNSPGAEEKCERYLMLFPHVLLMLSATPRMSGFIFQGKLPLSGMTVTPLEDSETHKNSFQLSGRLFECLQVVCNSQQDLQDWVDHLTRQTRQATTPSHKPLTVPCHTLPSHPLTPSRHAESRAITVAPAYHTLPHPSSHGAPHSTMMWGPLEPPNIPKPWSLSCLRPAPPLKPSAALCYKEDLSKSPKSVKKLLPKRKPERKPSEEESALRKSTAALEEDAQILKVIEAYCTSAKTRQTLNSTWQGTDLMHNHVLGNMERPSVDSPGHRSSMSRPDLTGSDLSEDSDYDSVWTTHSYRMGSASSLEDVVYALRDEVQELQQDNKKMKRSLEEEQRARKELDKVVRRVLQSMNNHTWDETNL
uniref:Rho guanine nucleotide exchange factor 7 n=1 Tax=Oncorhynchus kisutch TaxID=8019 RepID=A0A8C7K8T8_ONCKI